MLSARHEIFIEVATNLSFSRASEILFISHPSISKHIKELESFYKTTLFERKGNAVHLTTGGNLLLKRLKEAKKIQNQLEFELSVMKDQLKAKGQLKLGASTTVALYIITKIFSSFHQKYPDIKTTTGFLRLQDQLEGTERRIKFSRNDFNDAVQGYNKTVRSFPSSVAASMFGFKVKEGFTADMGTNQAPEINFTK